MDFRGLVECRRRPVQNRYSGQLNSALLLSPCGKYAWSGVARQPSFLYLNTSLRYSRRQAMSTAGIYKRWLFCHTGSSLTWRQDLVEDRARLQVQWRDATDELKPLFDAMLPAEKAAFAIRGAAMLWDGKDIYAMRVKLTNTGTVPVRIDPQNIRINVRGDSIAVETIDHSKFLQTTTLPSNYYIEGLVYFVVPLEVGAAMRAGNGTLSYNDRAVEVVAHR